MTDLTGSNTKIKEKKQNLKKKNLESFSTYQYLIDKKFSKFQSHCLKPFIVGQSDLINESYLM